MAVISVVIPTLNAGETLAATLAALIPAAVSNLVREVVLADAGSTDDTLAIAEDAGARVVDGGADPLAAGCAAAKGPWLLLLRPGARLSPEWQAAARDHIEHHAGEAGYFRLALDDHRTTARLREAWWAAAGGVRAEHGLLVTKGLYDSVQGRLGRSKLRPLAARVFLESRD